MRRLQYLGYIMIFTSSVYY